MRFIASRLLQTIAVMLCVATALFALLRSIPGSPAAVLAGPGASPQVVAAIAHRYDLTGPIIGQYLSWLGRLVRGNFGTSVTYQHPVISLIGQALQPTVQLVIGGLVVAVAVGISLGVLAAAFRGRLPDVIVGYATAAFLGVPVFWTGLLAILLFSVHLHVVPSGGASNIFQAPGAALQALVLPAVTLGLGVGSVLTRFVRASMLEVMNADYIRTARAKGASALRVLWRHAFRNALIPIVTVIGVQLGTLIAGAVVVESVFARPGMGLLLTNAIGNRDYPVVEGVVFLLVGAFSVCNLLVDLLYGVIDPRIRR